MKFLKYIPLVALLAVATVSCNKDDRTGEMRVKMTDAPGDYLKVNVELEQVNVHYTDSDSEGWIELPTNKGIYDLLELRDDVSVVIADEDKLPVGRLDQLRLILGDENSVLTSEGLFPLELSSQDKTGLKINIDSKIKKDKELVILLDFDAEKSVVYTGEGSYKLKPVLLVKEIYYEK